MALGQYDEAVSAFDKATGYHGYELTAAAAEAFELAKAQGRRRRASDGRRLGDRRDAAGRSSPLAVTDTSEFETSGLGRRRLPSRQAQLGIGDDAAVSKFFTMTEDEMKQADREARRAERDSHEGRARCWSKVLARRRDRRRVPRRARASCTRWATGGPPRRSTVKGLLQANATGKSVAAYWVAVPDKDVAKEMAKLPPVSSFKVESVDKGSSVSAAFVQITPKQGAPLRYKITLQREGVGWKVVGVDNNWASSGQ